MSTPPLNKQTLEKTVKKLSRFTHLTLSEACRKAGIARQTVDNQFSKAGSLGVELPKFKAAAKLATEHYEIPDLPEDDDADIEDIIADRKRDFEKKRQYEEAHKLIPVNIKLKGPIGILHFGDPHVDDNGTDIATLEHHMHLTKTVEGLFGGNVGDTTNNWVGRLARLYSAQNMGRARALKVAEWFIKNTNWLYMIGGNHDAWSGDDDPIKWIAKEAKSLYKPSEARLELRFPQGDPFRINARHDFAGDSQWNPAHGLMKAFQLGVRDHLFIAGHKHVSAYAVMKDPDTGITGHALRVSSYKMYDRYAKERGFRDQTLSPCAVTVIDPLKPDVHPDRCKVFWDADEGVDYLKFQRSRK